MSVDEIMTNDPVNEGGRAAADVELEMALLAVLASRDTGEATEAVRLDMLSPIDKEVLLQLIRGKLGMNDSSTPVIESGIAQPAQDSPLAAAEQRDIPGEPDAL